MKIKGNIEVEIDIKDKEAQEFIKETILIMGEENYQSRGESNHLAFLYGIAETIYKFFIISPPCFIIIQILDNYNKLQVKCKCFLFVG